MTLVVTWAESARRGQLKPGLGACLRQQGCQPLVASLAGHVLQLRDEIGHISEAIRAQRRHGSCAWRHGQADFSPRLDETS